MEQIPTWPSRYMKRVCSLLVPLNCATDQYIHHTHVVHYEIFVSFQIPPYSTPLGVAAQKRKIEIVERLLKGGATVKYQNKVRNTMIYFAIIVCI